MLSNMIIIIFNLFIMIHDHNKIIINVGQMIKLQRLKQTKNCESIILSHRWADIELILNKTYGHDNLIMIKFIINVAWKIKYLSRIKYNV
jgi:hypothetical protein